MSEKLDEYMNVFVREKVESDDFSNSWIICRFGAGLDVSVASLRTRGLDPDAFRSEYRLAVVQRGLKAVGTFSYQTAVCGRGSTYKQFIQPTLGIVQQAAVWLDRFPALRRMLRERVTI